MLNEHLAQLWANVHDIEHVSIRLFESDPISRSESILIKNGLFLLLGITLEKASAVLSESSYSQFKGRLLKLPAVVLKRREGFASFLSLLDEVDDIVSNTISSDSSQFKAEMLFKELHRCLFRWSPDLWRTMSQLFRPLLNGELDVETVRFLRQWCNLLSKVHIDRPDLLADSHEEYLYSEFLSFAETSVQEVKSPEYWDLITRIRSVLSEVVNQFSMVDIVPKHGPGAVADPTVKNIVQKYLDIGFDCRIDYLLRKGTGERMSDYTPFSLGSESRTSRVVFVPKSWKKLRGISAEPTGLQFFQQAVLDRLIQAISNSSLGRVINLRDQTTSRKMALKGSRDGTYATIDLSAASDSVTLRLVKDIFGSSDLCRWLLATRSTHTLLGQQRLEIYKFAPMGSACCFPVECLVFAGIALASAAKHYGSAKVNLRDFRVYGDDIICPSFFAPDIMEDLITMGFSVNTDKSYWKGDYRESCGMDAWRGMDVTPLKIKDFSFDFNGSKPLSYEHHSRMVSYLNTLYASGYCKVRSFLLKKILTSTISLGRERFKASDSLVFGDGSRGTVLTCQPDNFHIAQVPLKGLQRYGFKIVYWKPRPRKLTPEEELLLHEVNYFERLMTSRSKSDVGPVQYDLSFFRSRDSESPGRFSLGNLQMIPAVGFHDPWTPC